jgi:DNA helicase-2/ATP-dependent DNA helicase PcrA
MDSKLQKEIFKVYNTTKQNIFIEAGPGSGKTTTILRILEQTPFYKKSIFLAFNKSIAEEITNKVKDRAEVSTIHSLAYRLLMKRMNCKLKLNENKVFVLSKKFFGNKLRSRFKDDKKLNYYLFKVQELNSLYRMNLCSTVQDLKELINTYGLDFSDSEIPELIKFFDYVDSYNSKEISGGEMMIDFTDMIYLTVKKVNTYPMYDVVFVDEVQDLNPLQKSFIDKLLSEKTRFVAVGDPRQAIYSFMGSNLDSFNSFKQAPNTICLPLSVSYRCPKSIIELANQVFPGIEAYENNGDGVVRYGCLSEVRGGDFIICRNNLPLVEAYITILRNGLKSKILGRDLGENLLDLMNSISEITDLGDIVKQKISQLKEKGVTSFLFDKSYIALKERVDICMYLYSSSNESIEKTKKLLTEIFSDSYSKSDVVLMTGHKSKGLESGRVFYLYPELIPSKYASTPLDFYQEKCLEYVIITRAKQELIIIKSKDNG